MELLAEQEELRSVLLSWQRRFSSREISFRELFESDREEWPDFPIAYRAFFEFASPQFANLEIVIGEDIRIGTAVGVGIERRGRIGKRLGTRVMEPNEFAGGFESDGMKPETLEALLGLIADGRISVIARVWPVIGVGWTAAIADEEARAILAGPEGYDSSWWLLSAETPRWLTSQINFTPWPRNLIPLPD